MQLTSISKIDGALRFFCADSAADYTSDLTGLVRLACEG